MAPRPSSPLTWSMGPRGSKPTKSSGTSQPARTRWTRWTRLETWRSYTRHVTSSPCDDIRRRGFDTRTSTRGPGVEALARQPRAPQAHPAMARPVHHRGCPKARHLQASEQKGRSLHQCLEHSAATSLLPLKFQVVCTYFVLVF